MIDKYNDLLARYSLEIKKHQLIGKYTRAPLVGGIR